MHSFDVFETSLVRTVPIPDDLFYIVAESVLSRADVTWSKEEVVELARLRIRAGRGAAEASNQDHVPLAEIYRHIDVSPWGITSEGLMEEELRIEAEFARPVSRTKRELERLRDQSEHIVFISDTPIPSGHLKKMLEDVGVALPHERLYTSGDLGLSKASGRLFDYVREKEGPLVGDWVHHGDNPLGDIAVPRSKGIRTSESRDADLNRYERIHLTRGGGQPWVRSRIAGVARVARVVTDDNNDRIFHEIAAGVAAPLLTYFVTWVMREAKRDGLERLYFVSRDGDVLLHIVSALQKHMDGPDCRYLYGSRQAWLPSALSSLDRRSFDRLTDASSRTLIDLLNMTGLKHSEVSHLLEKFCLNLSDPGKPLDRDEFERFWSLVQHPDAATLLLERAKERREAALSYFEQEGLTSPGRWALVDIGWNLSSQWALRSILDTVGHGNSVNGFYMAVAEERRPMADTGPYRALFMPEDGVEVRYLPEHANVLEEAFFAANHGSVTGYGFDAGRSVPILQETSIGHHQQRFLTDLRQVVGTYANEAIRAGILTDHLDDLRESALLATIELLAAPTRAESRALASLSASDDLMHQSSRAKPLAGPMGLYEIKRELARNNLGRLRRVQELRREPTRYHWDEASLVLTARWIKVLLRAASLVNLRKVLEGPRRIVRGARNKPHP